MVGLLEVNWERGVTVVFEQLFDLVDLLFEIGFESGFVLYLM